MPRSPNRVKTAIIYRAVNLINGKSYIGLTIRALADRRQQHFARARNHPCPTIALHNAIRKYGTEMLRFSILKSCASYTEAKDEEQRLIALWHPEYNMTKGGDGTLGLLWTAERRAKHQPPKFWLGKKRPDIAEKIRKRNTGNHPSEETRRRLSLAKTGVKQRPETIERRRISNAGFTHSEETKRLLSALKGRPVVNIENGLVFGSAKEASVAYGFSHNAVWRVVSGHQATARGMRFAYEDAA